ncbi:MAG: NAD-dependent epimerase/dehydratase family protein [Minisyncoccia bacterium]
MKTVLVTGGAGFIGSNLVSELLKRKYRVVCVDNFDGTYSPEFKESHVAPFVSNTNFGLFRVDICDLEKMRSIFEKEKPVYVVHLAAKADTRDAVKNPYIYISVNVNGTTNILELSKKFSVKKVVLASSGSVYGNNPNIPWKEEENTDLPLSAYGATKKTTEMLAYTYHHNFDMNVVCLRYFNVYGENNRPNMVPYKWAKAFLNNEEIELSGEGTRKRDFTYVGDVVEATVLAMEAPIKYEILNIANSQPVSLKELISVFEKITGMKPNVKSRPSHNASVNEMYADSMKAQKLLNWKPKVSIEEGISKLVSWFRQNRMEKSV